MYLHMIVTDMADFFKRDPTQECLVLKTRRAARAITRRYSALLKPYGINSMQASVLFAILRGGFSSISELAEFMAIERSALTRNIALLKEKGLISSEGARQGKAQKVQLSEEGLRLTGLISPLWEKAQDEVREETGQKAWDEIQRSLTVIGKL